MTKHTKGFRETHSFDKRGQPTQLHRNSEKPNIAPTTKTNLKPLRKQAPDKY